jgi:hypothetical protein
MAARRLAKVQLGLLHLEFVVYPFAHFTQDEPRSLGTRRAAVHAVPGQRVSARDAAPGVRRRTWSDEDGDWSLGRNLRPHRRDAPGDLSVLLRQERQHCRLLQQQLMRNSFMDSWSPHYQTISLCPDLESGGPRFGHRDR